MFGLKCQGSARVLAGAVAIVISVFAVATSLAHDQPGSSFFVAGLPQDYFTGKILTTSVIGPESGSHILHATLDLTWIADPNMPASELGIEFGVPTTEGVLHWIVTGADLGWDDGPGPFNATIDTDQLNGEVSGPFRRARSSTSTCSPPAAPAAYGGSSRTRR